LEQIRSFIAIELPGDLKSLLDRLEAQLKADKQPWVKWVSPGSIHLTLKFLGSVPIDKTIEITGAIEEAAQGISPIHLKVEGLGVFPNPRMVQVAWVGVSGEVEKLKRLQGRIDARLSRLGFAPESRPFTPHLTLARLSSRASPDERSRFGQLITGTKFAACPVEVDGISLMKSRLSREGAIYSRISLTKLAQ
jgi:2'-5' RNA ligase